MKHEGREGNERCKAIHATYNKGVNTRGNRTFVSRMQKGECRRKKGYQ